jgi:hypothetical protein
MIAAVNKTGPEPVNKPPVNTAQVNKDEVNTAPVNQDKVNSDDEGAARRAYYRDYMRKRRSNEAQ